jgi:hypothetical protein
MIYQIWWMKNLAIDDNEWIESFAQDMYNPRHFKMAFLKVMKPMGNKVLKPVKFIPYLYQDAWTDDPNEKRITVKARQTGFSVNESLDTLHTSLMNTGYKKLFTSAGGVQATKNLTVIRESINLMEEEYRIKLRRQSDKMLEFPNGSQIYAMPSEQDAARGFSGDIYLDEFAFVPKDKEMLRGIQSVAVRKGYNISMGSTPFGQRGEFHRIVKECGWDTSRVWLDDSPSSRREFASEYKRVLNENETDWSFHAIAWWLCPDLSWSQILKATETEQDREQEFGLGFLDDTTAMFGLDMLVKRSNSPQIQFHPERKYRKPDVIRRTAGLDPAEKVNKTAYVIWDYHTKKKIYHKRFQAVWGEKEPVPLSTYVNDIARFHYAFNVDHMYIDGTGMGVGVHSMFQDRGFTESQMTKVKFTQPLKYDLVHNALSLYEAEPQRIFTDMDKEYNKQFHSVRKEVNRYGKAKYSGKFDGKDDDVFWAGTLGLIENMDYDDGDVWFEVIDNSKLMRVNRFGK